ncbi:MAG: hypothetical protein AAGJ94_01430 [Pseudomonadota bacterium]
MARQVMLTVFVLATVLAGCVNTDPDRVIDYKSIGFESDDGSR